MGTHSRVQRHGRSGEIRTEDAFFRAHGHTRVPQLVQWMVTLRCPLSCEHCLADDGSACDDLSLAHAARLVEQVAAMGVDEFLLTGGEPLSRGDLPEIIDLLRANRVRWSLNTALMPTREQRRAIDRWPPGFVAVSLDGPEAVHDAFRGRPGTFRRAMQSLAYFADRAEHGVAAGTTVTPRNFDHLPQTFGLVLESGATTWGLHLVVPEGRARFRPDLFLSRAQLKRLLRFAAAKRKHFPVTLADEIGYCGFWEPLVRDAPFFCGAGRAQCVVLPDGEVVPCTTLDRTTSAGNVLERPLRDIWESGFAELRHWSPSGRCERCRYAVACGGGCWLQRRHGTQCFREVWRVPKPVAAAGLAAFLGLASAGTATAQSQPPRPALKLMTEAEMRKMEVLQSCIVQWYVSQYPGGHRRTLRPLSHLTAKQVREHCRTTLPDDPGAKYFLAFTEQKRSTGILDAAKRIEPALRTEQRSLCLVGLMWRDLTECALDGVRPERRSPAERKRLREIVTKVAVTGEAWRAEIVKNRLDPFLRRPVQYRRFFASKACRPVACRPVFRMPVDKLAAKRGYVAEIPKQLQERLLTVLRYGEVMKLAYKASPGAGLRCLRMGKVIPAEFHVFDMLIVPADTGKKPPSLTFTLAGKPLEVALPPGTELTYGDILRLAHEQHLERFRKLSLRDLLRVRRRELYPPPLALPELERRRRHLEAQEPSPATHAELQQIHWALADLYLF